MRTVNKKRFFVRVVLPILVLLLAIISWGVIRYLLDNTCVLGWGALDTNEMRAVVVRQESLIPAQTYGQVEYQAQEGQLVAAGDVIATLYKKEYVQETLDELEDLERSIYNYQKDNLYKDIETPELIEIDINIRQSVQELQAAVKQPSDAQFAALESKLNGFITQRRTYLKNNLPPNTHLGKLYVDEADYLTKIAEWKQPIKAPIAGYVSYITDGCEASITPSTIRSMTSKTLKAALKNAQATNNSKTASVGAPIAKIISNTKCWVAAIMDSDTDVVTGSSVSFFVEGLTGQYTGVVTGVKSDKSSKLVVLEVGGDISTLCSTRSVSVSLGQQREGYRVLSSAIKVNAGSTGVFVTDGGGRRFVPVKVFGYQDGYAVFESLDATYPFRINQDIYKR